MLLLAWGWMSPLHAQQRALPGEVGLPFPGEHYAPQEYRHYPQNWSITQGPNELIYVANNDGVLEYDGASWRFIPTATNTFARSIATGTDGTIYVGAVGDFGYLAPDSTGTLQYISLFDEIPAEHRVFEDVWGTHVTPQGVYFQSRNRLFRWDGSEMKVWTSEAGFHTSATVHGEMYVRDYGRGLLRVEGDSLQLVPGGEQFEDMAMQVLLPYPGGRILVGTNQRELFLYDGQQFTPFETEADPFFEAYQIYHGAVLPHDRYAFATLGGGVVIISQSGQLLQVLGPSAELPDGVIYHVQTDAEGGLWMATNSNGLVYGDVVSPLSVYDERLGLSGLVQDIQAVNGTIYAGTGAGLFRLQYYPMTYEAREAGQRTRFQKVPGLSMVWDVERIGDRVFAAAHEGLFLIQNDGPVRLTSQTAFTVEASAAHPGWYFVGEKAGLVAIHRQNGRWLIQAVPQIQEEVRSIVEEETGVLWVSTIQGNVYRVYFPNTPAEPPRVEVYRRGEVLPNSFNRVSSIGGQTIVLSHKGVMRAELRGDEGRASAGSSSLPAVTFVPDHRFIVPGREKAPLWSLIEAPSGEVWMARGDHIYRGRPQNEGGYQWKAVDGLHFPKGDLIPMFVDEQGVAWVGTGREIMRYDPAQPRTPVKSFPTYVRRVTTLQDQRVLYGGAAPADSAHAVASRLQIPYEDNDLRFEFAAPHFAKIAPLEYQYRLEDGDAWSDWKTSTSVMYSGVREGNYTFQVRARTVRGDTSRVASFSFHVIPPWYRTWWAYSTYLGLAVVFALGYRRYREIVQENERAKEQAKELERERLANERLQEANRRLKEANELKDNFLSNTSHELRTPLTTILGFTDVLKEEVEGHHREFLTIIEKSGHRLLRTLNGLLDLAKLRAGVVEVTLEQVDVVAQTQELLELYQHEAEQKGVGLILAAPNHPVYASLDGRYYEQIIENLVVNALKFTDEGVVMVEIEQDGNEVVIRVRDTGVGIDAAFLPYLFDDFKQESTGLDRDHDGSGLGLAISSRLVELMQGTIDVDSTKGVGTTFTVRFRRVDTASDGAVSAVDTLSSGSV